MAKIAPRATSTVKMTYSTAIPRSFDNVLIEPRTLPGWRRATEQKFRGRPGPPGRPAADNYAIRASESNKLVRIVLGRIERVAGFLGDRLTTGVRHADLTDRARRGAESLTDRVAESVD